MARTFTSLLTHVVFSTSGRAPFLADAIRPDVHAYLGGILREIHAAPIAIGGAADHVHILTRLPADLAVADCPRVGEGELLPLSERERRGFAWQGGYESFSVSQSRRGAVIGYIQDQARHHRRISFQDEFLALLKNHAIEFDERYIWR